MKNENENEELRNALRTALVLWELGGQNLLEKIINKPSTTGANVKNAINERQKS
tara:strand:- start:771 stop:932 length:162 start_codon:yes stop_codon:yes gene_type:complete